MFHRCLMLGCLWTGMVLIDAGGHIANAEERISFDRQIRPLLSDRCFQCHGPSEDAREAGLRLDVGEGDEGPFRTGEPEGPLVAGDHQASGVWQRIISEDPDEVMPPPDSNKKPLSDDEKDLIRRWIDQGAVYEGFWAFVAPQSSVAPAPADTQFPQSAEWSNQPLDWFVLDTMKRESLTPQPAATKRTLIRRVTFDLTGLPPTVAEIDDFLSDSSPNAYERLVDRLISSPRYGEHMAKYWLDLVRFADTNGIHHDHYRESTPYRDWVIRAFNENQAFDTFIVDQIAGDLRENPTLDQQIASGFNRLHLVIDRGTALPEESYTRNVVDRVSAFGTAFMGLTLGCAACHDHKYDPITQRDFYQLFAFFNNIDTEPETPGQNPHPPFIRLPDESHSFRLAEFDQQIADRVAELAKLKQGEDTEAIASKEKEVKDLRDAKRRFENQLPLSLVSRERDVMRPAYILNRGAYDDPGEQVQRGTPGFLPPLEAAGEIPNRMDLARWVVRPDNPLTARVTVNRFWQQFFGVGLVRTSEDFGAQGEYPSHPKLLDDLASRFVTSGWDVKQLVRSFVMSQTYRQSSAAPRDRFLRDAQNRWLARGSRFRLDSEMIRDQVLAVCGQLNGEMYGKSVKPPQPADLWKNVSMRSSSTYAFKADTGPAIFRRSIYTFWKRAMPPPQMTIFDAPTRESCIARRERTNTPAQALLLMNEQEYFAAAKRLARQLLVESGWSNQKRLEFAYELITSHEPDSREMELLTQGLEQLRESYADEPDAAAALTAEIEGLTATERVELAAMTMVVNSLINLDITKTRE